MQNDLRNKIEVNKFLKLPQQFQEGADPDYPDAGYAKTVWCPYQQKVEYDALPDSSDLGDESP